MCGEKGVILFHSEYSCICPNQTNGSALKYFHLTCLDVHWDILRGNVKTFSLFWGEHWTWLIHSTLFTHCAQKQLNVVKNLGKSTLWDYSSCGWTEFKQHWFRLSIQLHNSACSCLFSAILSQMVKAKQTNKPRKCEEHWQTDKGLSAELDNCVHSSVYFPINLDLFL